MRTATTVCLVLLSLGMAMGMAMEVREEEKDGSLQSSPSSLPPTPANVSWELVFEDNFDGSTLNTSSWAYEVSCWGGGNAEKECYVASEDNVFVKDGLLNLKSIYFPDGYTGTQEDCTSDNSDSCTWTQPCTSGRISTQTTIDPKAWTYGAFETRAKLPTGQWLWPAVWMLPEGNVFGTWAASGEIDIMESQSFEPTYVYQTVHYGGMFPNNSYNGSGPIEFLNEDGVPIDFTADFHVFSVVWTNESIVWYVDGQTKHSQSLDQWFYTHQDSNPYKKKGEPFDKPFYLILNLAVAGQFFNATKYGKFDGATASPTWTQPYQIDYVRVYSTPRTPGPVFIDPLPLTPWYRRFFPIVLLSAGSLLVVGLAVVCFVEWRRGPRTGYEDLSKGVQDK